MRLNIDLPDWPTVEGRGLYILAGIEPIAIKLPGQPWTVKTGRCISCGKCCEFKRTTSPVESFLRTTAKEGAPDIQVCEYLIPDGAKRVCELGLERPFICCTTDRAIDGCTVTYQTLKA